MKLSVLVPVYNVEKYLRQCIDSIIHQTLEDLEIICIDDGSTDSSGKILDEYMLLDNRIRVIHKENSGYGDSMNIGLEAANGEYIGIVESDDFIEPDMYESLYSIAQKHNCDMVKGDFFAYSNKGKELRHIYVTCDYNVLFSAKQNMNKFVHTSMSIWAGIYRREYLKRNDIKFLTTPGASFQDISFMFKVFATAERGMLVDQAYLNYRIDNIMSSVKNRNKVYCVCDEIKECKEYICKKNLEKEILPYLVKMTFLIYQWNIHRIAPQDIKDFVEYISNEYLDYIKLGMVDRTKFTASEWKKFLMIAEEPLEYCKQRYFEVIKNKKIRNDEFYGRVLKQMLYESQKVYIYGAGKVGQKVYAYIQTNNIACKAEFLVTSKENSFNNDVEIYEIADENLEKNRMVVVAVKDYMHRLAILESLQKSGFNNIFILEDRMINVLK